MLATSKAFIVGVAGVLAFGACICAQFAPDDGWIKVDGKNAEENCSAGCKAVVLPARGPDGAEHLNRCIMTCSTLGDSPRAIARSGVGAARKTFLQIHDLVNPTDVVVSARLSLAVINKYKKEGFRFVARVRPGKPTRRGMPSVHVDELKRQRETSRTPEDLVAVRWDASGNVFVADGENAARALPSGTKRTAKPQPFPAQAAAEPAGGTAAHAGGRKLQWVISPDTRTRVTARRSFPTNSVGHLTFSGGSCSAVLYNLSTILTAGHCVHSGGKTGKYFTNFLFYAGRLNSTDLPYPTAKGVTITAFASWISKGTYEYDIAVINLNRTVGPSTMGYQCGYCPAWATKHVNTSGYPGDKPWGTQWRTSCAPTETCGATLHYQLCDVAGGQSGSPVWQERKLSNGQIERYIKNVVSHHACSKCNKNDCGKYGCSTSSTSASGFVVITCDKFEFMRRYSKR